MFDKKKIENILRESPGLTGKQIAKALGVSDKSALNKFIYANSDGLRQDGWKWFLADDKYVLDLESQSSWIDEIVFEDQFCSSGCLLSSTITKCVIRFPEKCKILLIAGARIIALANQAVFHGKSIELDFTKCPSTKNYLDRLGFFDHLNSKVTVLPSRPTESKAKQYNGNSENLVEIASINLDHFDYSLPKNLTKRFAFHAGDDYYQSAFTIFSELIGNVQEHSETPLPGFAALQLYKGKRRHIQTVISDNGLGIAATLKPNLSKHYPDLFKKLKLDHINTDIDLVRRTLTEGGLSQFGSNPDGAARGLGIKRAQSSAAKYDAEVVVRQPTFELKIVYKNGGLFKIVEKRDLSRINGTQVCFDFYLD
ncbi:TPA: ATP-binding protein [Vibrio parahaemolyticus]